MMIKKHLFVVLTLVLYGSATGQTVSQPGFEAPAQGAGKFAYRPTSPVWTFSGGAGLSSNLSPFTQGNPAAPEGVQVALIQASGRIAQTIPGWPAGSYQLSISAAQRNYANSHQVLTVLVDDVAVGTITAGTIAYQTYYTPTFTVAAGDHTLALQTSSTSGNDTVFLDRVSLFPAGSIAPGVAVKDAWIGTSGKVLGVRLQTLDGATIPTPYQSLAAPTLFKNGLALGPLGPAADLASNEVILYPLAPGDQCGVADILTVSAPTGWLVTSSGLTSGLTSAAVDNRTGRSPLPPGALTPQTLRPGVNCNLGPTATWGNYWPLKNWAYRVGWPPQNLGFIQGTGVLPLHSNAGNNGVDATGYPGPAGLWLVYWKSTGATPATFGLTTVDHAGTTVTERTDLSNPAAPGGYVGRVFDFERTATSTTANVDIQLSFNAPPGSVADLWVVGPGDFDASSGVPVTFDVSNPFATSRTFDQWTAGAGSLRWVDSSNCGGNPASCPYPEYLSRPSDRNWGDLGFKSIRYGFTSVGPVDLTVTPYCYSPRFGEKFPATLASDITTAPAVGTLETYVFSDADTAPLMAGLEVYVDAEVMRIISVSGSSVRVYRGSNGTTPATHTAGVVQVSGRRKLPLSAAGAWSHARTYQLTTDRPHGITTGNAFQSFGAWPQITWTDGGVSGHQDARYPLVTGPTTLVSWIESSTNAAGAVPVQSYPLNPSTCYSEVRYSGGIPPEVTMLVTAAKPDCAFHANINLDACDDFVWTYMRWVHDRIPAGRRVLLEYMNEPWNWGFTGFGYVTMSANIFGLGNPYTLSYYCQRTGEIGVIARAVFADRPDDLKVLINCQLGSDQAKSHLAYAAQNGWKIDRVAIAPYLNIDTGAQAFASWDDDQLCDLWINFLWNSRATTGWAYNSFAASAQAAVATYNTATGAGCKLLAYEGGIEMAAPQWPRALDLVYNPNWYWVEDTFYRWLDRWQFAEAHVYSLSQYHSPSLWGMYHAPRQKPGYGDGSLGGTDNRKRLARPGQPNSKPPGANVDWNDSVRGQAFRDRLRRAG